MSPPAEGLVEDLADTEGEPSAAANLAAPPPSADVRKVALTLLWIFGSCLFAVVALVMIVAWRMPSSLKDVIGFYGTVVSMLGTLLGGVVAFYFARR